MTISLRAKLNMVEYMFTLMSTVLLLKLAAKTFKKKVRQGSAPPGRPLVYKKENN